MAIEVDPNLAPGAAPRAPALLREGPGRETREHGRSRSRGELAESSMARLRFRYFIPRPGCNSSQGATASAFASRSTLTRADVPLRAREMRLVVRRAHG